MKFLYKEVLKDSQKIDLKFPKRDKIHGRFTNSKYKTVVSLGHECDLRVREVVNLKVADLDIEELTVQIKGASGKKDRNLPNIQIIHTTQKYNAYEQ